MIYISSSCVKNKKIKDSVLELVNNGFQNIELSGGTEYYNGFENDLLELKDKYKLNYICHNYFPPPKEHFVLNLASLNNEIYEKTIYQLQESILLSIKLGATRFGFHAGFYVDISVNEIGKKITKGCLFDKNESIKRFCSGFTELKNFANNLELYIENNVFSSTNASTYENENIFMLTNYSDYEKLSHLINFNLLLDIAHLKVSSKTLNLSFETQLKNLIKKSDYIHISDNDALHDLNNKLQPNSVIIKLLKEENLKNKNFTIEVYDNIKEIRKSYEILRNVCHD